VPADAQKNEPTRPIYERHLAERRAALEALARRERAISYARLGVFLVGFALLLAIARTDGDGRWLLVPAVTFVGLVVAHARTIDARGTARRRVDFYERALARIDERWAGTGSSGENLFAEAHPHARDLDLFGRGSLFELLCSARTTMGERTLAEWLSEGAGPAVVRARQAAVAELAPRLDLREEISLCGGDVRAGVNPAELAAWAASPARLASPAARLAAPVLVTVQALAWIGWYFGVLPFTAVLLSLGAQALFGQWLQHRVRLVLHDVEKAGRDLDLLSQLLAKIEGEPFRAPALAALRERLAVDGEPPSAQIARLHRLMHLLDARRNELFGPVSVLLLWATQFAFAVEAWRARSRTAVGEWLAAVGEMEALCSLAGYAHEHPEQPFPEIADAGPCFDAAGLAHPLLPAAGRVANDLQLDERRALLIVSGSNMSGKSTLLRAVGINAVLALAGAPVCAARLRLSRLRVGASICVVDSLREGISHFYAEIRRLRQIVELARGEVPLLFLLDEVLSGTNSHDRRIGAEAVIRGLLEARAIGLVTTHDLALTELAAALSPRAANVHFEDHLADGRMSFDYRLRDGVVRKSNALELMRAVGLRV